MYLKFLIFYSLRLNKLLNSLYKRVSIKLKKNILLLIILSIIKIISRVLNINFLRINYTRLISFILIYLFSTYSNFKSFL